MSEDFMIGLLSIRCVFFAREGRPIVLLTGRLLVLLSEDLAPPERRRLTFV